MLILDENKAILRRIKRYRHDPQEVEAKIEEVQRKPKYKRKPKLTDKRLLILKIVGDGSGSTIDPWLSFDRILERLAECGWPVDKKSLHFHLRPLIHLGYIEKRPKQYINGRHRRIIALTNRGRMVLKNAEQNGSLKRLSQKQFNIHYHRDPKT